MLYVTYDLDCQNFTMEEIPFASVNNSMYDTTFTSMAECFWSCFGLQNCFALSYDTTTACTRYTSCANDTCVIMGSKNSTVYLRHCNNGNYGNMFVFTFFPENTLLKSTLGGASDTWNLFRLF